jgi:adenine-specific DNA-methyltransferase
MDEIFSEENKISEIVFVKTSSATSNFVPTVCDYLIWYSKDIEKVKYRILNKPKELLGEGGGEYRLVRNNLGYSRPLRDKDIQDYTQGILDERIHRLDTTTSQSGGEKTSFSVVLHGCNFKPGAGAGFWKTNSEGMSRLKKADRIVPRKNSVGYVRYFDDHLTFSMSNVWTDTIISGRPGEKVYVVQTLPKVIERCILMTTDPGDLVLDPTCGSGTTAYVAEQWGRRWITVDTSRVALTLARTRIMGARYPYYILADSVAGQQKEAEITRKPSARTLTHYNIRQGFVYERVPHITLKSIANNTEIDIIWETAQEKLEPLRAALNTELSKAWEEWEIPREADAKWSDTAQHLHSEWWKHRIARQKEIDASIAAKADQEFLYDKPCQDKSIVRVAGPFTVESLSPHRVLAIDENDELIDKSLNPDPNTGEIDFASIILENLKTAGVQQAHKEDKINFTTIIGWPGNYICAEGRYLEGDSETEKRAGIFIGPEFGTVSRPDLVSATREAGDAGFDVLIACAFNYDAQSADFTKLGRIPVLKARMNADLHMADALKNTGAGNLFVVFGEPDIDIDKVDNGKIQVTIHGVDVFHPQSGEIRSSNTDEIACWFIDTNYNEESFFVRHAYFLGASDPYKSLKTTLKAEINEEAWESLYGNVSRPFAKPKSGRIAVKVINHLGDEVMKVFNVE